MATIKAFSDLKQSKKLAEILPLESADMRYEAYYVSIKDGIMDFPLVLIILLMLATNL